MYFLNSKPILSSKLQAPSSKQIPNSKSPKSKKEYNLSERMANFAINSVALTNNLPKTVANLEYSKQLIRSSSSIGGNYLEASESLGKKDSIMYMKISRKEAKESTYWLTLILKTNHEIIKTEILKLLAESNELRNILSSIIIKISY